MLAKIPQMSRRIASAVLGAAFLSTVLSPTIPLTVNAADVSVPAKGESPTIDRMRAAGEFRGGAAMGPPGLLQDPATGELVGPAMIIGREIAAKLGVKFVPVESNWDVIIAGLQSQRYDVAIAPLLTTEKRLKVVDIIPYYKDGLCYSVLKDNPKVAHITEPSQLDDPNINWTTVTGSSPETLLPTKFKKPNFRSIQSPPGGATATDEVISGRADVVTQNSTQAQVIAARYPQVRIIPPVEECMKKPDFEVPVGMAVLKGDPALVKFMNDVVVSLESEIDSAMKKYTSVEFMIRK
jgi:polar amino acid transport system substrate-binding protein